MNILEKLAQIPSARLALYVALGLVALVTLENLPWTQSVVEHLLNMEAPK